MEKIEVLSKFKALGLSDSTIKALKNKGFEEPTPIQEKTIPLLISGNKDIIAQAQTGTGKTAAFGLPLIELLKQGQRHTQALILSPTRELAIQVSEEINSFMSDKRLHVVPIYGGQSIDLQQRKLRKGVDIVVGTPGRVLDYLNRDKLKLDKISFLVLDEADEMLNMGFLEDVEKILAKTNQDKRTLLFSATMPDKILNLSKKYMKGHDIIKTKMVQLTTQLTNQIYFEVRESDKFEALCRIMDVEEDFYGLIFCRTKRDADNVSHHLSDRGYYAGVIHGDVTQSQREKVLQQFKDKQLDILVATDVAARGIDIQDLTHVINYALPQDAESYVHRIGRTGRAGKEGTAITFVTPSEYRQLLYIQRTAKADIQSKPLPKVEDIIHAKKSRLRSDIKELIQNNEHDDYLELAEDILKESTPAEVISALLKLSFQDELHERNYSEIQSYTIDQKGKTRLFIALGKKDGLTRKSLINMIKDKCRIRTDHIQSIKIFDKYSFVTAPFREAEVILQTFKKENWSTTYYSAGCILTPAIVQDHQSIREYIEE